MTQVARGYFCEVQGMKRDIDKPHGTLGKEHLRGTAVLHAVADLYEKPG